ncbi:helicase carboxy-terminal domain protein, putative (macronuclear) [Tetrahymena thermophila SB210]|uniref:Helicase carboxy-terminal domain protein, putative n=1 Tax=Tetrahymena thermophila (strain SB210) TaxID=312017 RepID=Q22U14_TETTS|nr:helicase carboxy-terminal domain protein, putative [Tetrahymena thermophila SB210]EAR88873.1 helicase carboxy-terminal domain protein, putative [Tetrahymena thermophila SB210]|eukprot:XP_001009118.1 helicase carboxy-terminal domain protein, putative [Tetrahymena thermophila SB210]
MDFGSDSEETKSNGCNEDQNLQDIQMEEIQRNQQSSQQSSSYVQNSQMEIQKVNLQEDIPSWNLTQVAPQKIQEQLESQLKDLLKQLDLENESYIQSEIQDTLDQIENCKKRNQQNKLLEKQDLLKKLRQAEQFVQKLKDLKQQTEGSQKQTQQQQVENQLNQLLNELELHDAKLITEEIEEVKDLIEKQTSRNQLNKVSESKQRLAKLDQAQAKYKELLALKGETLLDQNQVKQQQLGEQLKVLLQELDLENESYIQSEIQDTLDQIENCKKRNQQNKLLEKQDTLQKLRQAEEIVKQLKDLKQQTEGSQNQSQQQQLESQLNQLLNELELHEAKLITEEIEEIKDLIEKQTSRNQLSKVSESKIRLAKLEQAQVKYNELLALKGETVLDQNQVKQQQLEEKLKTLLKELDLENESYIQAEIQDTLDQIESCQKKNQQNKVLQKKETLDKLKEAEKIVKELNDLKSQTEKPQDQTQQQQLESELNQIFEDLDIHDANILQEEINDVENQIQKYLSKNQQNNANQSKLRLEKLKKASAIHKELLELKGETIIDQNKAKQQQLDEKLNTLLQQLDLKDASLIQSEIKEVLDEIEVYEKRNQQSKVQQKKETLQKLKDAEIIAKELKDLMNQIEGSQNANQSQQFESQLNSILKELDISDANSIQDEIEDAENQVQKYMSKSQLNNANQSKIRIEKLKEAQKIYIQLNNKNNENQIEQSQPEDSNNNQTEIKENQCQDTNLPKNQPLDITKRYNNYDDLRKDISLTPESSEKYLLEMIEICLSLHQQVDTPQTDSGNQQLLTQKEKIEKRLKVEELITPEINQNLQNIKLNIDQDNFEGIIDETDKLIKKVRPLNIHEMKRLIHEADKAAKVIEGQDIIILLGGTGAGKSTTIHFLAGSEMAQKRIQIQEGTFYDYIGPVKIKNKTLQKIKVGFSATSETRFITPVNINFKDLNIPSNDSIILCDSPGFDDTAGPEVDIANGLGIVKAIKKCKSVRPVILLSFKSQGDRGQGIKQLAHILVGFVEDIQDKLSSFSYLFSKYPKDYNINSELINIKKSLDSNIEEKSDKAFVSLFEDMIEKTKKSCNKIDPIKGNPAEILKSLIKQEGILDPSSVFKFSITTNSYSAITEYTQKTQQTIISALSRSEYELINFKLDELKFLMDILSQESTKQTYEYCVNYIKDVIKKEYENATEQLNQQINNNNKLDTNYLRQYQELIQKFQQIQSLKNNHLGAHTSNANDLIDQLKFAIKKLAEVFDQENIIQTSVLVNLGNIKLISEYFPEVMQQYNEACQKIQKQIEDVFASCIQALKNKNFDDLAQAIYKITQYRKQFKNHLDDQPILDQLERIKDQFKTRIDQSVQEVIEILKLQLLKDEDINIINEQISIIENAEKNLLLAQNINIDYVKNQKNNLFKNLLEKFEKISKKIEEILRKEPDQAFLQLKNLVEEMDQFRKINGIENRTADTYYKSIQEIQSLMQQIKRDVEQLLSDFQHDKKKVDFQKIYRCLNQLKCAQWMNDVNKGAYDQTITHISQELLKYSQFEIIQKLGEIDLSQKNYGNIQVASELIKELEAMILFEEYNSKLTELRENACSMFKKSVQVVFNQVKELINAASTGGQLFQVKDKEEEKQELEKSEQKEQQLNRQRLLVKLDGSKIEDYLNYIRVACQNKWTRDDANTLLEQLKEFLAFYKESKNQQILNHYENIIDLHEQDEKKKTQSALQLSELIQELMSLQKYEETSSLIQPNQLIQDQKNRMQQYYIELSHDMSQPTIDKQKLAKSIIISKLLSHTDNKFEENKFFNLYQSKQNALNDEFKDNYKKILQAIEKNDFVAVKTELMQLDDNPVNQKAMNQIKAQLQYQTETLLEQAKLDALALGNQIEKDIIMKIIKTIEIIKKSKSSFKEYFEKSFLETIDTEIESIISDIDQKISKFLESITALLKQSDFFEVEEKREYITQILQLLAAHSKDKKNKDKLNQLQSDLEKKVEEITATKYEDEKDFIFHPPKQILEKLSKVKGRNLKYAECYTNLQQILIIKVRQQIVDYQSSDSSQQSQQILKVETLMNSVPEELKQALKDQFDTSKQQNEQRRKVFEDQFNELQSCEDLDRKKVFLDECKAQKMHNFEDKMRKLVQEECQSILSKFQEDMESGKPKDGVQKAIKLLEYNKHFENDEKIKSQFEKVSNTIKEEMKNKVNNLKCIEKFEDNTDQYEKEYELFLNLLQTIKDYKEQLLSSDFDKILQEFCSILQTFFIDIFKNFDEDLNNDKVQHIEKDLTTIKKWENLVQKLKKDFQKVNNLSSCFEQLPKAIATIQEKSVSFKECMEKLANRLFDSKNDIMKFNFIQDLNKDDYYKQIQKGLQTLKQAQEAKIDFKETKFEPECYEKECIPTIVKKIEEEEEKVYQVLRKEDSQIQDKDYKQINQFYENIESLKNNVNQFIPVEKHIDELNDKIDQRIDKIENNIDLENVDSVAQNIIQMKKHSENLHPFKKKISGKLDNFLKNKYFKDKESKSMKMAKLAAHLQDDENGYGAAIIEESEVFKGVSISIFNESTQKHGIDYVIENIRGDEIDKTKLKELYMKFEKEYQEIVTKNLLYVEKNTKTDKEIIEDLVIKTKQITNKKVEMKEGKINWDNSLRQKLPSLVANLFALWTLLNTQYFKEVADLENKHNYLLKPHAGQVISIFRLIGIGYSKDNLYNNLVQLGTGEGKSIILAITSITFALFDMDIYCACYSEYLSQRDYNSFVQLFNTLGVTPNIKYGIFNKICEQIINENGQVRDLAVNYITNGFSGRSKGLDKDKQRKPKILLIDEVDVFFSQDFYGKLYNPIARLQDQCIIDLAQFIWNRRSNYLSLKEVQETECYQQCISKFKNLNCIIDESIKDMISDSRNFEHKYVVQNLQIGYQEQDGISFDITYGYKTLFAYFYELEQKRVSESKLKENTFISIKCGSFSYSEIPFKFDCIVGVTGTLETLSVPEKNIVQKIYNITKDTYIPSVFGKNNRKFAEKDDTHVEDEDDYFKVLRNEIERNLNRNGSDKNLRSVLVFFESKQKLINFYQSDQMKDIKMDVEIITEEVSTNNDKKQQLIKKATVSGQITLLTSSFGRGTDFICRDQKVLNSGGVHVIQTFYSSKKSEEVQIMGRSARQGQVGSYSLVLLDQELQRVIGPGYEQALKDMRDNNNHYKKLGEYRKLREDQEYDNRNKFIEQIKKDHEEGQKFVQAMLEQDEKFIKEFLASKNKGTNEIPNLIRILCLVDGTGSMGPLLNKAKTTVSEMFERSCKIIKNTKKNIPEDCFKLQFAVYRDYDQKEGVLQASPWESKVDNLRLFLDTVKPAGGGDYEEAVEIGFQHANQENQNQEIAAIILLADAPSKSMSSIKQYREKYGGESYWKTTKYSEITDYKKEMQKLKAANIPIHSFYLDEGAKSNFEEISAFTNGKCEGLNIDSNDATDKLIQIVVEPILKNVGKQNGLGDDLYQEYLKLFAKSYK